MVSDSRNEVIQAFQDHCCKQSKTIGLQELPDFSEKIGLQMTDDSVYVLVWKLKCVVPMMISEKEWTDGVRAYNMTTMRDVSALVERTKNELKTAAHDFFNNAPAISSGGATSSMDAAASSSLSSSSSAGKLFRDFYGFLFSWTRADSTKRNIDKDSAIELWENVFSLYHRYRQLPSWVLFVRQQSKAKEISQDVWNMFLEFARLNSYDSYDVTGAWPTTMDQFVEWYKENNSIQR